MLRRSASLQRKEGRPQPSSAAGCPSSGPWENGDGSIQSVERNQGQGADGAVGPPRRRAEALGPDHG